MISLAVLNRKSGQEVAKVRFLAALLETLEALFYPRQDSNLHLLPNQILSLIVAGLIVFVSVRL